MNKLKKTSKEYFIVGFLRKITILQYIQINDGLYIKTYFTCHETNIWQITPSFSQKSLEYTRNFIH